MANKTIIGILVFLVLISGGLGAYSLILNKQIDTLSNEVSVFKGETATEISDVRDNISTLDTELTVFKGETATKIGDVRDNISTLDTELAVFEGETAAKISSVRGNISTLDAEVTAFKGETATEIASVTTEISQSSINAQKLYESVRKAACEITDGEEWHGSGFVLDNRGYIITAHHVIDELDKIDVILYDGTICSASIVGSCQYSDVAVLEIEETANLEPLDLADSSTVVPGETVMILGSPFYLPGTITSGIVGKTQGAEAISGNDWVTANLVQYDAASNPGNSGGPLVNSEGEVIGMVIARVDPALGSGINWAVSSNKLKRVAASIIDSGSFENATLPGTWTIGNLTPEAARDRNMETTNGVLFLEAEGIDKIEANDIVVAVDGVPLRECADLFNYFGEYKSPGDTVTLTVIIRGGIEIEVSVELVEGWVFAK